MRRGVHQGAAYEEKMCLKSGEWPSRADGGAEKRRSEVSGFSPAERTRGCLTEKEIELSSMSIRGQGGEEVGRALGSRSSARACLGQREVSGNVLVWEKGEV